MERVDNYLLQARQAKQYFLRYDQDALIAKLKLQADDEYLYVNLLCEPYRIRRDTGDMERCHRGNWVDANSHREVMTILDLVCDSRADRFVTGRWKIMQAFGMQFHSGLLEKERDPWAIRFDRDPESLHRACLALGGKMIPGADICYSIEFFDGLPLCIQFWHGDEEFSPRLRYLWDENADRWLKYETMYFALNLLHARMAEEME